MKQRLITGAFIAAAFVGIVLAALCLDTFVLHTTLGHLLFDAFVLALMVLASLEVARAIGVKGNKPSKAIFVTAIPAAYACFFICEYYTANLTYSMLAFSAVIALAAIVALVTKYMGNDGFFETSFVLVYPIMVLFFMILINHIPATQVRAATMVMLFFCAPLTDTFAFLVGVTVKGPKLCPEISPKKTISGAIGGLFGGAFGGLIVYWLSVSGAFSFMGLEPIGTSIDILHFILMGLLASVFTQGGDLAASYVKRKSAIKDYGKLLPGHGGVMDRIDGFMFAALIIYFYAAVIL